MRYFILFFLLSCFSLFAKDQVKVGAAAPVFQGTTLDGKAINLADYKGKVVLLDFWASWCVPCRLEMPYLATLHQRYQNAAFEIITVNIDDKEQNARRFIDQVRQRILFPVVKDPQKKLPPKYQIKGMPTTVLIDKNGVIRYWHTGFKTSDKQKYVDQINTLLQEKND